jgi:malate synthase
MVFTRGYTKLHQLLTNSQKIFQNAAVLYEQFFVTLRYTVRTFRDSGSLEVVDLRFVLKKIFRMSNAEWKTNPNYLSGDCHSRLSYQCQPVRGLFERILACTPTKSRFTKNCCHLIIIKGLLIAIGLTPL